MTIEHLNERHSTDSGVTYQYCEAPSFLAPSYYYTLVEVEGKYLPQNPPVVLGISRASHREDGILSGFGHDVVISIDDECVIGLTDDQMRDIIHHLGYATFNKERESCPE